ncbi:MAG: DUF4259 domain-containing protein [Sphingomonas sp.]|nr:DUF4259 domain-containing protein [Sphingomonas sp.]
MGAWGSGSFENDAALDWAAEVRSIADVREPFERLKAEDSGTVDVDLASEVVAAAETVAMLMGRKSPDFPDDLAERLSGELDNKVYHQARSALMQVMRSSELAELWQEGVAEGEPNEWLAAMTRLIERLNPDVEPAPWPIDDLEKSVGPMQSCAFCDQPIPSDKLWAMTLYDVSNRMSGGRGLWMHLECLNARMHHKHAVVDLKFDPNNMPEPDKL